jgi:two-component system nitrogen regulation response regulator GlnG/two-component system response regulator HydG
MTPPQTPPDNRAGDSTLPPESISDISSPGGSADAFALVVLWCRDEPERAGEALLFPRKLSPVPWVFGRGEGSVGGRRILLARQRPGRNDDVPALACQRISRSQLRLTQVPGGLQIESTGRCQLLHEGRVVARVAPSIGDVIELQNELLLLFTTRPPVLPEMPFPGEPQPFGAPDAFGIVGESPAAWDVRRRLAAASRGSSHVLVLGPSGSGKELVAQALHAGSDRAKRPLVSRNAATIPEGLAAAELFGNIRNYPNPGTPDRPGLVGQADGSTLFLDEIAELPPAVQAQLLRVLDQGEHQRVGESVSRRSSLRLVGATNRPPEDLKHDFLARFHVTLRVPGLDERREDVPLLAAHLLRLRAAADPGLAERFFHDGSPASWPRLSPALVTALVRHSFVAHVRELGSLLLRACESSAGRYLELTPEVREGLSARAAEEGPRGAAADSPIFSGEDARRLELHRRHRFQVSAASRDPGYGTGRQTADLHLRQLSARALRSCGWDVEGAARLLAGPGADAELFSRARDRLQTFVENLRERLASAASRPDGEEELRRALSREWRSASPDVLGTLDAIREGRLPAAVPEGV